MKTFVFFMVVMSFAVISIHDCEGRYTKKDSLDQNLQDKQVETDGVIGQVRHGPKQSRIGAPFNKNFTKTKTKLSTASKKPKRLSHEAAEPADGKRRTPRFIKAMKELKKKFGKKKRTTTSDPSAKEEITSIKPIVESREIKTDNAVAHQSIIDTAASFQRTANSAIEQATETKQLTELSDEFNSTIEEAIETNTSDLVLASDLVLPDSAPLNKSPIATPSLAHPSIESNSTIEQAINSKPSAVQLVSNSTNKIELEIERKPIRQTDVEPNTATKPVTEAELTAQPTSNSINQTIEQTIEAKSSIHQLIAKSNTTIESSIAAKRTSKPIAESIRHSIQLSQTETKSTTHSSVKTNITIEHPTEIKSSIQNQPIAESTHSMKQANTSNSPANPSVDSRHNQTSIEPTSETKRTNQSIANTTHSIKPEFEAKSPVHPNTTSYTNTTEHSVETKSSTAQSIVESTTLSINPTIKTSSVHQAIIIESNTTTETPIATKPTVSLIGASNLTTELATETKLSSIQPIHHSTNKTTPIGNKTTYDQLISNSSHTIMPITIETTNKTDPFVESSTSEIETNQSPSNPSIQSKTVPAIDLIVGSNNTTTKLNNETTIASSAETVTFKTNSTVIVYPPCGPNEYSCGSKCHPVLYFNNVPLRHQCADGVIIINSTLIYFPKHPRKLKFQQSPMNP